MPKALTLGHKLFNEILNLREKQTFLIIFDAFGYKIADYCAELASITSQPFYACYFPRITQLDFAKTGLLQEKLRRSIRESSALLFAIADHEDCTKFRAAVLNVNKRMNILHLPGVDYNLFRNQLETVNIPQLRKEGIKISKSIKKSDEIEIITKSTVDDVQKTHKLNIKLDKSRNVHLDVGASEPGQIAQLPAGEVYLAPAEYTAEGDIAINGAVPQRVMTKSDNIILAFHNGIVDVTNSYFSHTINGTNFKDELLKYEKESKNNITLGEFGIGLNKSISRFTGKPIRDEKGFGSAHIALGENTPFEGDINCDSHIDLIFIPFDIKIGGNSIPISWGLG